MQTVLVCRPLASDELGEQLEEAHNMHEAMVRRVHQHRTDADTLDQEVPPTTPRPPLSATAHDTLCTRASLWNEHGLKLLASGHERGADGWRVF